MLIKLIGIVMEYLIGVTYCRLVDSLIIKAG